jgi:hypothetical protein
LSIKLNKYEYSNNIFDSIKSENNIKIEIKNYQIIKIFLEEKYLKIKYDIINNTDKNGSSNNFQSN